MVDAVNDGRCSACASLLHRPHKQLNDAEFDQLQRAIRQYALTALDGYDGSRIESE
jgi:hypothetical protein